MAVLTVKHSVIVIPTLAIVFWLGSIPPVEHSVTVVPTIVHRVTAVHTLTHSITVVPTVAHSVTVVT